MADDPDPNNSNSNGPTNDVIEQRTWEWFSGAVSARFGPAYYQILDGALSVHWPDVMAVRAHDRVGFEITSPLRPEDVVRKRNVLPEEDDAEVDVRKRKQRLFERRVVEAINRKMKKYGRTATDEPLALLVTLAHPSAQKFFSAANVEHLSQVVKSRLGHLLHQPIDAVYLVGPGVRAYLLWRRRGAKWSKLFPDLDELRVPARPQ